MNALLIAAAAAALQPAPATPQALAPPPADAAIVAEIRKLEHDWGQAFVKRDFAFIDRIVAPEFRLAGVTDAGQERLTFRAEWMRNSRAFQHEAFAVEVVDVAVAGDTAVALAQGLWRVKRRPDRPAEAMRFAVTDTWVRRGGQWQVIYRYSHRLPQAPWPPAPKPAP
ncbi:nuclear transport factor 2 family protein [Sphingomonas sinipercae]|uniref:Nuclear transport factor 2 family protein n=1 Tax=Sphingomonas sinipercae TaxID=2714944 RepID=A0A6G7ZKW7_9SPHN|nr:nuclear transport factor 2 family protein [Sphingomonas sinipercae]QIL01621.1 nuclear transport factor 2 family protein [Sphingomonas sinipercae]